MRRVLFVCTGNYYRSRFAEAVFNHHAEIRGLNWRACSRGLKIEDVWGDLSAHTDDAMRARGILRHHTSETRAQISERDFNDADRVIALDRTEHYPMMTRQFSNWADRIQYWEVADIGYTHPADALSSIEKAVLQLIDSLRDR